MSSKTAPTKLAKSGGSGGSNGGGLSSTSPKASNAAVNGPPSHPSSPLRRQGDTQKSNSSLSSTIPSDISYKLCKKIAQLTKVIYYLNTKNEDHSTEVQSLVSVYEQEINDCISDGNDKIEELRQKLVEKELEFSAHEQVIQSYMERIKNYENEAGRAKKVEAELQKRIEALEEEKKHSINENFLGGTRTRQTSHAQSSSAEDIVAIKREYEGKIYQLEQQNNQVLLELKTAKDELEAATFNHKKDLEAVQNQLSENDEKQQDVASVMKKKHDEEIKFYKSEVKRIKTQSEEQERKMTEAYRNMEKKLSTALDEEEKKNIEQDTRIRSMQQELNRMEEAQEIAKRAISDRNSEIAGLKLTIAALEEKLNETTFNYNMKVDECLQLEMTLHETNVAMSKRIMELDQLQHDHSILQSEAESLRGEVASLTDRLDRANSIIKDYQSRFEKMIAEKEALEIEVNQRLITIGELRREVEEEKLKQSQMLDITTKTLTAQLTQQFTHEREIQVNSLTNRFTKQVQALTAERNELSNLYETTREKAEMSELNMRAEFMEMKTTMEEKISTLETTTAEQTKHIDFLSNAIAELNAEKTKLLKQLENAKSTIEQMEEDRSHLYQKMMTMEEQVRKEMIQKFEIETEEMKKELTKIHEKEKLELKEGVLQAYAQDLQKILERIEEERKTEKNEIIRNYEDRLEEARLEKRSLEDKILRLEDEKGLMLKQMIEAKEDYHRELENNTKKMHEEMLQMKKALENETLAKLTELKVAASIAQANLVKKHQASMEELLTKHAEELKSLTDHFNELQEASKVEFEALKEDEIRMVKEIHLLETDKLRDSHAEEMEQLEINLNTVRMNEIRTLDEKYDTMLSSKNDEIQHMNKEIEDFRTRETNLQVKNIEMREEVQKLNYSVAFKESAIVALREKAKEDLKKTVETLNEKHKVAMDKMNRENLEEARKMLQDFEMGQNFLKNQIAVQTQQLQDADLKYINRESREDDVLLISQLQDEVAKRKKINANISNELEYFKLELNNREANFNKIFNKTPLVGVMQPTITASKKKISNSDPNLSNSNSKLPPLYHVTSISIQSPPQA